LESRLAPAAVSWNGGAGTLNWGDANNWSNNLVPGSADDVTISKSGVGTITIAGGSYAVRTLNDTTAALSLASSGSLSLAAVAATSTFGQNVTVQSGATLTVGAGASVLTASAPLLTLTDDGTMTFAAGATLTLTAVATASSNATAQLVVGNGGLLTSSGAAFNAVVGNDNGFIGTTLIAVNSGGHLQASNSTFAVGQLNLAIGTVLNAGDLAGNAFDLPLFIPAIDLQYLSGAANNNLRFKDIDLQPDTLTNGQSVALNAIGTQTTTNLRYVFPGNFTVNAGATLAVGPNVPVLTASAPSLTLTDDGTMTFAAGDTVTLTALATAGSSATAQIIVGSGGLLTSSGTAFNAVVGNDNGFIGTTLIAVSSGGHLQASNSTFAVGQLNLAIGTVLNAGDLAGNAFDLPLFIPAIDVQYLSGAANNNLRFKDIDLQPDTLTNGQSVALNAIGTQTTTNLRYVFPGNFTVNAGATLAVGPNVPVLTTSAPSLTLTDNGTMTFAASDTVTLTAVATAGSSATAQLVVGSGGLLTSGGVTFNSVVGNDNGFIGTTLIAVSSGGHLQASNSTFAVGQLNLAIGTVLNAGDLVGNAFDLPLFIPAIDVQYLSGAANNNLRFKDIDLQPDTLTNGQSVALDAIGTQTTTNLRYVFPGSFTVNAGATLAVGPNVPVLTLSAPSLTLTDNGTMTFGAGDTVTLTAVATAGSSATAQLVVGSGGLLTSSGVTFNSVVGNDNGFNGTALIAVNSGGHLQASTSTFALSNLSLNNSANATLNLDTIFGVFTINSGATIHISQNDFSNLGTNDLVAVGDPNATIDLTMNYWGTTDPNQIAAKVLDHAKDSTRPTVLYSPFLNTHPALDEWTGANFAVDTNWSDGNNWSLGSPPTTADTAFFTNDATVKDTTATVDAGFTNSIVALTIDSSWGGTIAVNNALTITGNFTLASGTCGGPGAVSIAGTASQWTGGTLDLGTGGFTNTGTMLIDTTAGNLIATGAGILTNNGTIDEAGTNGLLLESGATLGNAGGKTFNLTGNGNIGQSGGGTFTNAGTLEKTGGTATSTISSAFVNSGAITVAAGALVLASAGSTSTGGTFNVSKGATLDLTGGATVAYQGTYTGTGAGTVALKNGTLQIASGGATFNMAGKLLQWTGGTIDVTSGSLTNAGTMNFAGTGTVVLSGANSLINNKSILQTSTGNLSLDNNATLNNAKKGTYNIASNGGITQLGGGALLNAGTLEKSKGSGTTTLSPSSLSNTGTVAVTTGTLDISATVTQAPGSTLTAGTWTVKGSATVHATLDITSAGSFTTIGAAAKVTLSGLNTTFSNLSGLATIDKGGSLTLAANQSFTTAGALTNNGSIMLSPGSILTVSGCFTEGSTGKLTLQMGLVSSIAEVGNLVSTTGAVSLAGRLSVTSTAIPAVGSSFAIVDNEGNAAISGNFTGLTEGATFTVKKGTSTMTFQISYVGTDGDGSHNVVITRIS
jgi:hypothetical protein